MRHFGYQNDLHIKQDIWDDQTICDAELRSARCFELTRTATNFLSQLYKAEIHAGVFDQSSAERVFASSPYERLPWNVLNETYSESSKFG